MKLITVHIPEKWREQLDQGVANGLYPNRSGMIRAYIRQGMKKDGLWREMLETCEVSVVGKDTRVVTKKKREELKEE